MGKISTEGREKADTRRLSRRRKTNEGRIVKDSDKNKNKEKKGVEKTQDRLQVKLMKLLIPPILVNNFPK